MLCPGLLRVWFFCFGSSVSQSDKYCLHGVLEGSAFQKIGEVLAQAGFRGEPGGVHWKLVQYRVSCCKQGAITGQKCGDCVH